MTTDELAARLKTFALILKFGHDLFDCADFQQCAAMAVNDSMPLLNFRNAAIFELRENGDAVVAGVFGQAVVNPHAAQIMLLKKCVEKAEFGEDDTVVLTAENGLPDELAKNNGVYLACKLPPPQSSPGGITLVWMLEYEKEVPAFVFNTAKLLGKSISEALNLSRAAAAGNWKRSKKLKRSWIYGLIAAMIFGVMLLPVPERSTAEFTLKAQNITTTYAWFDGHIAECLKQDGDTVKKGDVIIRFDTAQLQYRLAIAKAALRELEAELELEQQNSFTDQSKLGKVKLLNARRETLQVSVAEAQWFLDHAEIAAPADGVLALNGGRAESFSGKAVRTGDKLFDLLGTDGMIAEIPVNERDASVLQKDFSTELFLHTAPETAIPVKVLEVARYPELTGQQTFSYIVRARMPDDAKNDLRFGMRGVAKLSGSKVKLGYMLFKSLILYFRNW